MQKKPAFSPCPDGFQPGNADALPSTLRPSPDAAGFLTCHCEPCGARRGNLAAPAGTQESLRRIRHCLLEIATSGLRPPRNDTGRKHSQVCHCEAPQEPWRPERAARGSALGVQSQQHSAGSQGTPGENGTACTRFPRRFAPRNDKSGAIVILMTACSFRQHCAEPGCPLPYNA